MMIDDTKIHLIVGPSETPWAACRNIHLQPDRAERDRMLVTCKNCLRLPPVMEDLYLLDRRAIAKLQGRPLAVGHRMLMSMSLGDVRFTLAVEPHHTFADLVQPILNATFTEEAEEHLYEFQLPWSGKVRQPAWYKVPLRDDRIISAAEWDMPEWDTGREDDDPTVFLDSETYPSEMLHGGEEFWFHFDYGDDWYWGIKVYLADTLDTDKVEVEESSFVRVKQYAEYADE